MNGRANRLQLRGQLRLHQWFTGFPLSSGIYNRPKEPWHVQNAGKFISGQEAMNLRVWAEEVQDSFSASLRHPVERNV